MNILSCANRVPNLLTKVASVVKVGVNRMSNRKTEGMRATARSASKEKD